uniref:Uncharacterized protein n=1 Tax=Vitis vinifera TaxID=29760 RepID=A5AZM6_VITVI|nr:hypothetical protein VITISV_033497 [Vitis vinifera]
MTYEINLNNHQRVEENKKSIAFMALTNDDEEKEIESESDEDSMEEECINEDANMCFMALEEHEDEVNSNSNYNEFQDVLQELYFDLEKLGFKNVSLKKKISCLHNELNELKEKFENIEKTEISFEKENEELKKKNEWQDDFQSGNHKDKSSQREIIKKKKTPKRSVFQDPNFIKSLCKRKNLSVRYHLGILKCGVSLERLFKSGVSFEDCKGCLERKVQEGGLEP